MHDRNTIEKQYTWDLTRIYEPPEGMDSDLAECSAKTEVLASFRGRLAESSDTLADAMDALTAAMEKLETASCYAFLQYSLDGGDPAAQTMLGKTQTAGIGVMTAASFLEPEILEIPEETLEAYLENPRLATHRHYFHDILRGKAHILDAKSEELLSKVAKITGTANDVYTMFTDVELEIPHITDEDGNDAELTQGNFGVYRESACRRVREDAFNTMFGTYKKYNNTFATLYAGNVKKDNMSADIRGHAGACEAALFGGNVPVTVYDSLIEAVHQALPSMNKYLRLRKKALGLPEIDVYDLYCPMVADVEYPMPYEDAKKLVKKALSPLGEEYGKLLDRAFSEICIDVY
ncbi:MAG: oligoendopeptidase F, partial [Clostridia bacterium]|nr:oligoendopeptidase F [Clostridia bacterium]